MSKIVNPRPFFYCFLALLFSIAVTRYIFVLTVEYVCLFVALLVGIIATLLAYKKFFFLFLILSTMLLGGCLYFAGINTFNPPEFSGEVLVTGRLSDDVSYEEEETSYLLKDVTINGENAKNIELTITGTKQNLDVGDVVMFKGEVKKIPLFSLNRFNLSYYRNNVGYTSSVEIANLSVVGNDIKLVERFRLRVKEVLYENMTADDGATAYAVLFGYTNDIEDETYSAYQNAGILHLLAVSGLNVTFLIQLIGFLLKLFKVNRHANFVTCFVVLVIYSYLCSFAPSIVRAGIMGIIFLACSLSGRAYDSLNTLGFAGILMLLTSPLLAFDVGFLMSYFCVIGIVIFCPILTNLLSHVFPKVIASSFAVSISATIAILPFMAIMYSKLNLLSFFTNIIAVPLFGIAYPYLCVATMLTVIFPFLGFSLTLCGYIFTLVNLIAKFFANTPLFIQLTPMNIIISALLYLILFVISYFFMTKLKTKILTFSALALLITINATVFALVPMCEAGIYYTYTDENSFVLLTNEKNETLIVDATWEFSTIHSALLVVDAFNVLANVQVNNVFTSASQEFLKISNLSHSDITNIEGTEILPYNTNFHIGDFRLKYVLVDDVFVGLEIEFDNVLTLRANADLPEEILSSLSNHYDLILAVNTSSEGNIVSPNRSAFFAVEDNRLVYKEKFFV